MPITISYGSPAMVGAASFAIGREKGRLKAGAQAAKFAQGALDRRDRAAERNQERNDRLGVLGAQMSQRERLANQRQSGIDEQRRIAGQVRASQIGAAEKARFQENQREDAIRMQKREWDLADQQAKRDADKAGSGPIGPFARGGSQANWKEMPIEYGGSQANWKEMPLEYGANEGDLAAMRVKSGPFASEGDLAAQRVANGPFGQEQGYTEQQKREVRKLTSQREQAKQNPLLSKSQQEESVGKFQAMINRITKGAIHDAIRKPTLDEEYQSGVLKTEYGPMTKNKDGGLEGIRNTQLSEEQEQAALRRKLTEQIGNSVGQVGPDGKTTVTAEQVPELVDKMMKKLDPQPEKFDNGGALYPDMHEDEANKLAMKLQAQGKNVKVTKIGKGGDFGAFVTVMPEEPKEKKAEKSTDMTLEDFRKDSRIWEMAQAEVEKDQKAAGVEGEASPLDVMKKIREYHNQYKSDLEAERNPAPPASNDSRSTILTGDETNETQQQQPGQQAPVPYVRPQTDFSPNTKIGLQPDTRKGLELIGWLPGQKDGGVEDIAEKSKEIEKLEKKKPSDMTPAERKRYLELMGQ